MSSANRKLQNAPAIVVPKPNEDQPKFGRVGLIAAVGFAIGIAWPGIARLQLVPQPPSEGQHQAATGATLANLPAQEPSAKVPVVPTAPSNNENAAGQPRVRFTEIVSCVDADGKKHRKCGELALDKVLVDPLRSLVACDGASGQKGVLSIGFDVDFVEKKLSGFTSGRSTTLPSQVAEDLMGCAKSVLEKVELDGVEHGYNRYRVFYLVELQATTTEQAEPSASASAEAASGTADEGGSAEVQGASGRATVAWEVAMIRKTPKTGAIVARVLGGTRLVVTGRQGDWYRVKYDAEGHEGFVFKAAIGL